MHWLCKIIFDGSITPHIHLDAPARVQVNGDLSVGSSNIYAENVNSNLYVETKYLKATAGARSNQTGVSSDLAMLMPNNKELEVDSVGKNADRWRTNDHNWVNEQRLHKNRS